MNAVQEFEQVAGAQENLRRPGKRDQDELAAALKAERVQEMLRAMPEWRPTLGGKEINRLRELPSLEVATHYATFVASFAKACALPVCLRIYGGQVLVAVHAPRQRGRLVDITESVVNFAQQLG
jgi:hypothetical protein